MASLQFSWASLVCLLFCGAMAQDRLLAYKNPAGKLFVSPHNSLPPVEDEPARPYQFGFKSNDGNGTSQHRQESRDEHGDVRGSYGYTDPLGVYRTVEYYTDANGYHAKVMSNEPGLVEKNSANAVFVVEKSPVVNVEQPLYLVQRRPVY